MNFLQAIVSRAVPANSNARTEDGPPPRPRPLTFDEIAPAITNNKQEELFRLLSSFVIDKDECEKEKGERENLLQELLRCAVCADNISAFRLLFAKSPPTHEFINRQCPDGQTLVMVAARYASGEMINALAETQAADFLKRDHNQKNALMHAVDAKNERTFKVLLDNGLSYKNDLDRLVSLPAPMLRSLSENGAEMNSALLYTASREDGDQARAVLSAGANINTRDRFGDTALAIAVREGRDEVISVLIEKGADVNLKDKYGETPLRRAVLEENLPLVRMLLGAGASGEEKDGEGVTPRMSAMQIGNVEMIKAFVDFEGTSVARGSKDGHMHPLENTRDDGSVSEKESRADHMQITKETDSWASGSEGLPAIHNFGVESDEIGDVPRLGVTARLSGPDSAGDQIVARPSERISAPRLCGFQNVGSTCFSNSALKFLISGVGHIRLIERLEKFILHSGTAEKKEAANKFIDLIKASVTSSKPLNSELRSFFSSLQKLDGFRKDKSGDLEFQVVGKQQDVLEFMNALLAAFELSDMEGYVVAQCRFKEYEGEIRFGPGVPIYATNVGTNDRNATLQTIFDDMYRKQQVDILWNEKDTQFSKVNTNLQFSVKDLSGLQRFTINISATAGVGAYGEKIIFNRPIFTESVSVVVRDEKTEKDWLVTFEPAEIIVHRGDSSSGHYWCYVKNGQNDWTEYDDAEVTQRSGIGKSQARMISYSVKEIKELGEEPGYVKSDF